jgi:hypothetical protein
MKIASWLLVALLAAFGIAQTTGCGASCNGDFCGTDQYCAYLPCHLETGEAHSECIDRPKSCESGGPQVCGNDGHVYANQCQAAKAGHDLAASDGPTCAAPEGTFACGSLFCRTDSELCFYPFDDCDTSAQPPECLPVLTSCDPSDCKCLTRRDCDGEASCSRQGGGLVASCN